MLVWPGEGPVVKRAIVKRVYFAHPIVEYGTDREWRALKEISRAFKGYEVVNPGDQDWQASVMGAIRLLHMDFFDAVAAKCDALVFMSYADGKVGAGVYSEIQAAARAGRKIYEVTGTANRVRITRVEWKTIEPLSVAETKERTYGHESKAA